MHHASNSTVARLQSHYSLLLKKLCNTYMHACIMHTYDYKFKYIPTLHIYIYIYLYFYLHIVLNDFTSRDLNSQ